MHSYYVTTETNWQNKADPAVPLEYFGAWEETDTAYPEALKFARAYANSHNVMMVIVNTHSGGSVGVPPAEDPFCVVDGERFWPEQCDTAADYWDAVIEGDYSQDDFMEMIHDRYIADGYVQVLVIPDPLDDFSVYSVCHVDRNGKLDEDCMDTETLREQWQRDMRDLMLLDGVELR